MNRAPWIADIKGAAGRPFEISVLRDDNKHGKLSYGWFGPDKLLISHNGGPCQDFLTPLVWDRMVQLAHYVADTLNQRDSQPPTTKKA